MTQISASRASRIWFAVRNISPTKIEVWFDISIVEKAMPKIRPTYLARSPSRILRATLFMGASGAWGSTGASDESRIGDGTSLWLAFHGSTSHNVYGVIMGMDVYFVNTLQATLLSSWRPPPGAGSF